MERFKEKVRKVNVQVKRIGTRAQAERALDAIVDQAGGEVALAAMNLTTGEEVTRNGERSMPTASVFKLPLLVEVFRQATTGSLDLDERVTLRTEDVVVGSGILRDFGPGLQPTLRDLAMMMVIVSDNSATNLLLDRVGGPQQVNATMRDLGLPSIVVHRRSEFGRPQPIGIGNKTGFMNSLRADTGLIMIDPDVRIAYSVVNDTGADDTYRQEHPGDIVNALIGRVLVEYWWPGEWSPGRAVYPSPYVETLYSQAGL